jgi:hypothetical protein
VRLRLEVAVLEHAGHLDYPSELDLAPAAADVRPVAQSADEIPRLAPQLALRLGEVADLDAHLGMGAGPLDLEPLELPVELLEGLGERGDEVLHRLLALLELARREVEERLVVAVQRLGGERAETRRKLGILAAEQEPGSGCSDDETDEKSDDH